MSGPITGAHVDAAIRLLQGAQRVVVLTGAGISTESGIPDFRGPQGIWTKNPQAEKQANIGHYMNSSETRIASWRARVENPAFSAQPNAGHVALAELERSGKLTALVTQNVDGLHQAAGSSPALVVEMHGTIHEVMCMACGERAPMERALARVRAGEDDPPCRSCGGILKSATISFGQQLDPHVLEHAQQAAERCDLFFAIGTTLTVTPVAYLPQIALEAGARLLILNEQETPFDPVADVVLRGRIGEVLPSVVAAAVP
jgi:NAD-dependent deacetylase